MRPGAGSWYSGFVERDRALGASGERDGGSEEPVVRADQHAFALCHLDGDGDSVGRDAGVDHRHDDAARDIRDAPRERQAAGPHVERRDVVREVDRDDVRCDVSDHRLENTDELVGQPVVGEKRHRVVATTHATATLMTRASETRNGPMVTPRHHRPDSQGREPAEAGLPPAVSQLACNDWPSSGRDRSR